MQLYSTSTKYRKHEQSVSSALCKSEEKKEMTIVNFLVLDRKDRREITSNLRERLGLLFILK